MFANQTLHRIFSAKRVTVKLAVLAALGLAACAQQDVALRPDGGGWRSKRNEKPSGEAAQLFQLSQFTSERMQEIKKIMERAVGGSNLPKCANREVINKDDEKSFAVNFDKCGENRGVSSQIDGTEHYYNDGQIIQLVDRSLQIQLLSSKQKDAPKVLVAKMGDQTSLKAKLMAETNDLRIYNITLESVAVISPVDTPDKTKTYQVNLWGLVSLNKSLNKITQLKSVSVLAISQDQAGKTIQNISWMGDMTFDPKCTKPTGKLMARKVSFASRDTDDSKDVVFSENGMVDGLSGQKTGKFPCDENQFMYFTPMVD